MTIGKSKGKSVAAAAEKEIEAQFTASLAGQRFGTRGSDDEEHRSDTARGMPFKFDDDVFGDADDIALFDADVSQPKWSPFAVYPKPDSPSDEILSLVRELNGLYGQERNDQRKRQETPPSQSLFEQVKTQLAAGFKLGTGVPVEFDTTLREQISATQSSLTRNFPDYEEFLFQKSVRELGRQIRITKKFIKRLNSEPEFARRSPLSTAAATSMLNQQRQAQATTKRRHVEHMRNSAAASTAADYDLSSKRQLFVYLIQAIDAAKSIAAAPYVNAGRPSPANSFDWWFADGLAIPNPIYGSFFSTVGDAILARFDSMADDLQPGQVPEVSLPVTLAVEEIQQHADLIVDLLPDAYFAGDFGSPANTTDSRNTLKAMVCEQLEKERTQPKNHDGDTPATSPASSSNAGRGNIEYAALTLIPMAILEDIQAPRNSWGNTIRLTVGAIISGAVYLTVTAAKSWWPFNKNTAAPTATDTTAAPSAQMTNATMGAATNASGMFIEGVTTGESDDSINASSTNAPANSFITLGGVTTDETSDSTGQVLSARQTTTAGNSSRQATNTSYEQSDQATQANSTEAFRIDLQQRLSAVQPVLTFVRGQLRSLINESNQGQSTQQILSSAIGAEQSNAPATALKNFLALLGVAVPDLDEKLALGNAAPYNRSLELIDDFIEEAELLRQRLSQATSEQLSALQTEINWVHTLPAAPPVRNRDMWKALTNGRNILALWDLRQSDRYSDFISGYNSELTAGQKAVETSVLSEDFLSHAAADFRRTFGVSPGDPAHAAAGRFRAWEQEVKVLYDRLSQGDLQVKLNQYRELLRINIPNEQQKAQLREIISSASMRGLHSELSEKLKTLPNNLLLGSKLEKLKTRAEQRMSAMQAGRALSAMPALGGVGNRLVGAIYANTTNEAVTGWLGAAEELFAAIKVPWEIAWTAADSAKTSGTSFRTELKKKIWDPFKAQAQHGTRWEQSTALAGEIIELRTISGRRGYEISMQKLKDDSLRISKQVSQMARRDPLALRKGNALAQQFRNQLPFLAQDITALVLNSYNYAMQGKTNSEAAHAELGLKVAASVAYLSGTSIGTFFKGHSQILATRSFNALGVAANIGAGIANIVKISERTDENRSRDMALATTQLIFDTSAIIGATAMPVIGTLLTLAIPNFSSIGSAMDFHEAARVLDVAGKPLEAKIARTMRDLAIVDAIPVLNWFSFIYRAAAMEQNTVANSDIDSTVATNIIAQLRAMQPDIASSLPERVGDSQVYPMLITPVTLNVSYYRNRPGPATPNMPERRINETQQITLWAAFGKEQGRIHVFPGDIRHSVWRNQRLYVQGESYSALQNSTIMRSHSYENRSVLQHDQVNAKIPEFTVVDGRSSAVDTSGMTLYLRNRNAARPTIYVVQDQGRGKLRIHSNDERSTFVVSKVPEYLNGFGGRNSLEFSSASTVSAIDLNNLVNISTVYGSATARKVTGDVQNMTYVSDATNQQERVRLRGSNNTVVATNGSDIALSGGNNRIIAQGIPARAIGSSGDLLSFALSPIQAIRMNGSRFSTIPESSAQGESAQMEFIQLTQGNDDVEGLSAGQGFSMLDTGAGNDTVSMHGITGFTLLLGSGTDTANISAPEPYHGQQIYGQGGAKTISMELRGQNNTIVTSGSANSIRLAGMGESENSIALALGGSENTVSLEGDLALDYHLARNQGAGTIYDNPERTRPLHIVFRGAVTQDDIRPTIFLPIDTAGSVDVRFSVRNEDGSEFSDVLVIHTWPGADILCTTEGDGKTFRPN